MVIIENARVLAIDPTSTGFSYAVLDGPERLLEWQNVHLKTKDKRSYEKLIEPILWRRFPDLIVTEDGRGAGSRRGESALEVIRYIEAFGKKNSIPVRKVSRGDVRYAFRGSAKNKEDISAAIGRLFPELEDRLPMPRKGYRTEDYRMNVFDAISFALAIFRSPERLNEIQF